MGTEVWQIEGVALGSPLSDVVTDSLADRVFGLEATVADILAESLEIEWHLHNVERWWGALAVPDETNAIDANVDTPFAATSGNDTWGAAIPILGTADNPVLATDVKYDCHRVLVTDLDDQTDPWRLRIIWGSGTSADAITAGQWTEIMVEANAVPGNRAGGIPLDLIMQQEDIGMKLWAQAWNDTNGEVLSFFWGAHGYPE